LQYNHPAIYLKISDDNPIFLQSLNNFFRTDYFSNGLFLIMLNHM